MFDSAAFFLSFTYLSFASAVILPRQGAVTALSPVQIIAFKPYTFFASAGYCNPRTTIDWSCGANCDANPGFVPVASGGDGVITQFWFVGFDPALNTVVVSHQGTDLIAIIPAITDANFLLTRLNQTLFPRTSGLEVHKGFGESQARSAPHVLAAVRNTLAAHPTKSVTIVGHSLGAAIALIDAVYLPLHLPPSTTFKYVGYATPRVGNPMFASYLDVHLPDLTRINNKKDPVPTLPGRRFGFAHPHGEIHIQNSGEWDVCVDDDNDSKLCSRGAVPTILQGRIQDHGGPYDGVKMGSGC